MWFSLINALFSLCKLNLFRTYTLQRVGITSAFRSYTFPSTAVHGRYRSLAWPVKGKTIVFDLPISAWN